MHNDDNIILRKIPIDKFIDVLVTMYNHGVDYIDIGGAQGNEQDEVIISFTKEYMSEEGKENIDDVIDDLEIDEEFFKTKLTDEDLDELI
jgi:hypothetical protein